MSQHGEGGILELQLEYDLIPKSELSTCQIMVRSALPKRYQEKVGVA